MRNPNVGKKNKVYLIISIICFIGCIAGLSDGSIMMTIFYLAIGILFLYLWKLKNKASNPTLKEPTTTKKTDRESAQAISFNKPKESVSQKSPNMPVVGSATDRVTKRFSVAGTSYKQKEIESLAFENIDYSLSKKEICEQYCDGGAIYKYVFSISNVHLEPEPTNEHDANAVKVIADDVHIGYIKQGKCSEVKNLLNSSKDLSISIEIYGGPYKFVSVDYDDDTDKNVYSIEKETSDFRAKVSISYKK